MRSTVTVQADDFAVEDRVACVDNLRETCGERRKPKGVPVPGHQAALPGLEEGERPEPVEFQFEEPDRIIKGLGD